MRRYDDPVEVRRGVIGAQESPGQEGPTQFLWHGRLWQVRAVLAHWIETGPWWQSGQVRAVVGSDEPAALDPETGGPLAGVGQGRVAGDLLAEREMWRVEAGRGAGTGGVFDLSFSWDDGHWQLIGCAD